MRILGPPRQTRYRWDYHVCYKCAGSNATVGWSYDHYNWITANKLRFGRCTLVDNVCALAPTASSASSNSSLLAHSWAACALEEAVRAGIKGPEYKKEQGGKSLQLDTKKDRERTLMRGGVVRGVGTAKRRSAQVRATV